MRKVTLVMRKVTLVMRKVNKYFGIYLGYLPMIPTSPQCDTFQLIPVSFLGFLRTFHLIINSGIGMI
jgi:hypothetical protein